MKVRGCVAVCAWLSVCVTVFLCVHAAVPLCGCVCAVAHAVEDAVA